MATINSLVCWGGLTGKNGFTVSTATSQITLTRHGIMSGLAVFFSAWTTRPNVAGATLALDTRYYPKWISDDVFELYYDAGLTSKIVFTTTGAGLYLKSGLLLAPADLSRWYNSTTTTYRIYDSLKNANTVRSASAVTTDLEVIEIGEAFRDHMLDYSLDLVILAASVRITASVNGLRTSAHHNGNPLGGYEFVYSQYNGLTLLKYNMEVDGFRIKSAVEGAYAIQLSKRGSVARNMIITGPGSGTTVVGIGASQGAATIEYCVVTDCGYGLNLIAYEGPFYVRNNLFAKNGRGVEAQYNGAYPVYGFFFNNIAIGNVTYDWSTQPPSLDGASNNAGVGTQAWVTAGGSRVTIGADWNGANPLFRNYAANDFYPATPNTNSSLIVETGTSYYAALPVDITGSPAPNYMNGAVAFLDIGPYEFDHGYGPWPVTATLTLTGLVSGSDIVVLVAGTSTILTSVDANAGSSWGYTYTTAQNVDIGIIKPGYKVKYIRNYPLLTSSVSIPVEQQPDPSYS